MQNERNNQSKMEEFRGMGRYQESHDVMMQSHSTRSNPRASTVFWLFFPCQYLCMLKSSVVCTSWNEFMLNKIPRRSCKEWFHSNSPIRVLGNCTRTLVPPQSLKGILKKEIGFQPSLFFNIRFQTCLNSTPFKALLLSGHQHWCHRTWAGSICSQKPWRRVEGNLATNVKTK